MTATDKREHFIAGLRELADFLESKPGAPIPATIRITEYLDGDELREAARHVGAALKSVNGTWFGLLRKFGPVVYEVFTIRENVCERVVTGKRTVTKKIPDPDAPLVEVTEEVEDCEWVCPDSLLAGSKKASA